MRPKLNVFLIGSGRIAFKVLHENVSLLLISVFEQYTVAVMDCNIKLVLCLTFMSKYNFLKRERERVRESYFDFYIRIVYC